MSRELTSKNNDIRVFDPITMEVFSNRLLTITEEMGNTLIRASFSPNIKERKDCSVALFDYMGRLISQAAHIPMHLGSLAGGVEALLRQYEIEDISDGDAFMCNDPYLAGGTHAPDITIVTPIFCDGNLRFFAANIGHHSDVGGSAPGSVSPTAGTVFEEGLRIPLVRVARNNVPEPDILAFVSSNSREPEDRIVDLKVQIAANERGKRLVHQLVAQLGLDAVEQSIEDILLYTERRLRGRINGIANGSGSFTTYMDDDGLGGEPVPITATVTVEDDSLVVDFEGSGRQSRGGYNMPESAMRACVYYVVKTLLDPDLIANEGMFGAIELKMPQGTITNPNFPAAVGMRAATAQRVAGAVIGAFAPLLPAERLMASGNDAMPAIVMSGQSRRRNGTYVYVETIGGGSGALYTEDGMDGTHVHITNSSNLPAEALENEYPLLVEEYALVPDSGGYGQYRGGLGIARQIRALDDGTFCYASTEGTVVPAAALLGGGTGGLGSITRDVGSAQERRIPANQPGRVLQAGESIRVETPGGGGVGVPGSRAVSALATDFLGGKLSAQAILDHYGAAQLEEVKRLLPDWAKDV
ncbi:hydantoinase B/oxoprolinase family protein [Govanella unica]|uniref:Hydantoinase B/oxoprolinase family protein n=1 Tax=Govanella unica TaxID=2975056 RepID=A0A9X3U232_9PROT|nr:hydantoinase B/oxoprolinase family protein [Govania unica]MDA5195009.1 hydantoinase B/oxoprolinase family protein [Govania unica]